MPAVWVFKLWGGEGAGAAGEVRAATAASPAALSWRASSEWGLGRGQREGWDERPLLAAMMRGNSARVSVRHAKQAGIRHRMPGPASAPGGGRDGRPLRRGHRRAGTLGARRQRRANGAAQPGARCRGRRWGGVLAQRRPQRTLRQHKHQWQGVMLGTAEVAQLLLLPMVVSIQRRVLRQSAQQGKACTACCLHSWLQPPLPTWCSRSLADPLSC